jgi:hypothetical protein
MEIKSYRDLIVWQKSKDLAVKVYLLTKTFPSEEKFSLISQMQSECFYCGQHCRG